MILKVTHSFFHPWLRGISSPCFHIVDCLRAGVYWGCSPSAPLSLSGVSRYQLSKLWSR